MVELSLQLHQPNKSPDSEGNSSGTGGNQRLNTTYTLQACQDQEGSPDVVTGM